MKYLDEYRNPEEVKNYVTAIAMLARRSAKESLQIMEVCGGQTHAIVRFGLDRLLPKKIHLLHGPGCPVCVTPMERIDEALAISSRPEVIFCSFGDMVRVPGSKHSLLEMKAKGADLRIVYSPMDALEFARKNPQKEIVFFAVGFETTAPANAMAVYQAKKEGFKNFSVLVSHVLVPPAIEAILNSKDCRVDGFLAAGHVCTIMGINEYRPLAKKYKTPLVVTGFEPLDILQGILMCMQQLNDERFEVENQYSRSVRGQGNLEAQEMIKEVFEIGEQVWRGIGSISQSGLQLRKKYQPFDAREKFLNLEHSFTTSEESQTSQECLSGQVLQGLIKPQDCPYFAKGCSPEHPRGATMVSSEGACAAYYQYRRMAESI